MSKFRWFLGLLFSAVAFWAPQGAFAADLAVNCTNVSPAQTDMVALETQANQVVTITVNFTERDCEVNEDWIPLPTQRPDVKIERLALVREWTYEVLEETTAGSKSIVKGKFAAPIGKNVGNVFDDYQYGPGFPDVVHDASFWNIKNGKTVPSEKFRQSMVVQVGIMGVMFREAGVYGVVDIDLYFEDLGTDADGLTATDIGNPCATRQVDLILNPNPALQAELVGYERMLRIVYLFSHEVFHVAAGIRYQNIVENEFGLAEESFAQAYANQVMSKFADPNSEYRLIFGFSYFLGADVSQLRAYTNQLIGIMHDYYGQKWQAGSLFENYVFAPVVGAKFPQLYRVVNNLFTKCHTDGVNVAKVAADYGIATTWRQLVNEQVTDCLYVSGAGLYRNYCNMSAFSTGNQVLHEQYECIDTPLASTGANITAINPRNSNLWYLVPAQEAWVPKDWVITELSKAFYPANHALPNATTVRACIMADKVPSIFNFKNDQPITPVAAVFLPLVVRR